MSQWADGKIIITEYVSHTGINGHEIHFSTPDYDEFRLVEEACRRAIDMANAKTENRQFCCDCERCVTEKRHYRCSLHDMIFYTPSALSVCEYFRNKEGGGGDG